MAELKPKKELFDIATEEVKNLSENRDYAKILINEEFKPRISENFSENEVALIAIEDIDKIENIIQKIVTNDLDKEKKGRDIISNINYTHIGFCKSEEDSIIFIFAKKVIKKEEDKKKRRRANRFFTGWKDIIIKSFIDKKDSIKNKRKREDFENFINSLDKMEELKPTKELCNIAKEESKLVYEDDNYKYKHIQILERI